MKNRITLAAFAAGVALGLPAVPALAQSKLTLYGLLDVGVGYVSDVRGTSTKKVESNTGLGPSRLGFLGFEDLGGGTQATFRLETRMFMDTGRDFSPAPFWVGGSYLGLFNPTYGTVTIGRQFDFLWKDLPIVSTAWVEGGNTAGYMGFLTPAGQPVAVDTHGGSGVYDNTIKWLYTAGTWSGGLMYGRGKENGLDRMNSGFVKYATPTLEVGAGWTRDNFSTVIANEVYTVRALYRPNTDLTVYANYSEGKETVVAGSKAKTRPLALSFAYFVRPNVTVGAGAGHAWNIARNGESARITEPFVATRYFFSKTTLAYLIGAYNHTSDQAVMPATLGVVGGAAGPSSSNHQVGLKAGLLHAF